jgi:hypothetical protein
VVGLTAHLHNHGSAQDHLMEPERRLLVLMLPSAAQRYRLGVAFSSRLLPLFGSIKAPPNVVSDNRMAEAGTLPALGTDFPTASASDPSCICRSQRHEHSEDDDANARHQNDVAVSFYCQCLLYIEALIAIPAMPRIVPAMT